MYKLCMQKTMVKMCMCKLFLTYFYCIANLAFIGIYGHDHIALCDHASRCFQELY